ncbi:GM13962 [Drosophila sechellia]|uniref:GM13962 n=2 Tax=Drosophila sechellia TaxID=7238 RepID=B4HU90_DROSE|nr:GM13962 [Drosophila sechellia]
MPNLPQKAQQRQPQEHKSLHKAPDDTEAPKQQQQSFDVATNANGFSLPAKNPEDPGGKPPLVPMRQHHSKVTRPPPPPTLFLENSLLQRQFANPISYLGGPRLQPRSNRTSIDSILSLD